MGFSVYTSTGAALTDVSNAAAYVTSLPSSPYDGQTVVYAADATNGVMWTLRYRAASSSSYKWEVVGGTVLSSEVTTYHSTSSTTFTDLTTSGPSVTLPLAGDYIVSIGMLAYSDTTAGYYVMSYAIGGTAAAAADQAVLENTLVGRAYPVSRTMRKTGLSAVTLTSKYRTSAGTLNCSNRYLSAMPIRVG